MKKKREPEVPSPEEVLRRMLNTPPHPKKKKKAKRKGKKKPAK